MNKLEILKELGFKVKKETFDFIQNAYHEPIKHLCKVYGDNLILWGCDVSGTKRTSGAVVVDGELLPFEESTDGLYLKISDNVTNTEYQGGEVLPSYHTRVASASLLPTAVSFSSLRRIKASTTDWTNCTALSHITVTQPIQARIGENGKVQLKGAYRRGTDVASSFEFIIPEQFRPSFNRISCMFQNGEARTSVNLKISTDGLASGGFDTVTQELEYIVNCEYDL